MKQTQVWGVLSALSFWQVLPLSLHITLCEVGAWPPPFNKEKQDQNGWVGLPTSHSQVRLGVGPALLEALRCFLVKLSLCPRLTHSNLLSITAFPEPGNVCSLFVI